MIEAFSSERCEHVDFGPDVKIVVPPSRRDTPETWNRAGGLRSDNGAMSHVFPDRAWASLRSSFGRVTTANSGFAFEKEFLGIERLSELWLQVELRISRHGALLQERSVQTLNKVSQFSMWRPVDVVPRDVGVRKRRARCLSDHAGSPTRLVPFCALWKE